MIDKPETSFSYAVYYQTTESGDDWYEMRGRDHNAPYRHPSGHGSCFETTNVEEALDTAEALTNRRAYPSDPKAYHYIPVTAACVVTRVHTGHTVAVFGAPNVSRETLKET